MAKLSREEIRAAASKAGFSGDDLTVAVAVALAESGGDTTSHNTDSSTGDNSYGLWQINMLGSMGPERRKRFNLKSNDELFNADTNARAAYGIWKTQGWAKGWTTYKSGKYRLYMTPSERDSVSSSDTSTAASATPPNPILGVGDAINAFGSTIYKSFANFAGIVVAIALLIVGIVILSRSQIGKAAKVVKGVVK
jgi:hypothetical protein